MKKIKIDGWIRSWEGTEKDFNKHKRKIHSWVNGVDFVLLSGYEPASKKDPTFNYQNEYKKAALNE